MEQDMERLRNDARRVNRDALQKYLGWTDERYEETLKKVPGWVILASEMLEGKGSTRSEQIVGGSKGAASDTSATADADGGRNRKDNNADSNTSGGDSTKQEMMRILKTITDYQEQEKLRLTEQEKLWLTEQEKLRLTEQEKSRKDKEEGYRKMEARIAEKEHIKTLEHQSHMAKVAETRRKRRDDSLRDQPEVDLEFTLMTIQDPLDEAVASSASPQSGSSQLPHPDQFPSRDEQRPHYLSPSPATTGYERTQTQMNRVAPFVASKDNILGASSLPTAQNYDMFGATSLPVARTYKPVVFEAEAKEKGPAKEIAAKAEKLEQQDTQETNSATSEEKKLRRKSGTVNLKNTGAAWNNDDLYSR